ncbi:PREDICTED: histone-lysine N-methyltransferase SETD1B-like [Vollenhovia emeryi]|uniref:histone-lysine N-methyltransferase SETD1B-like n=1 Tax=Vollenhovia emeryi TaxID=411798 RepID=UPI0005F3E150|nr:PREDICTED: histone-lysine N-methyltransferase SETD1B-like [Vollenhovia emeryi]
MRTKSPVADDSVQSPITDFAPSPLVAIGSGSFLFIRRAHARRGWHPWRPRRGVRLSLMLVLRCVYVVTQEMLLPCKASHVEPGSMKRAVPEQSGDGKRNYFKHESIGFGYDAASYANYPSPSSSSSTPSAIAQPLPGQPPLPPMPPPPSGVPPPPHVFGPVPSQVAPIQWTPAHTPWQWIASQTSPLPPPTPHEIANTIAQREIPLRGNYVRRERFHSRSNVYAQRNNFHRKNRRVVRFGQPQAQFDQAAYFGATLAGNLGLEWRRGNYPVATSDAIINHMTVPVPNHPPVPSIPPGIASGRHVEEAEDQDVKIEKVVKKNKQRKPMSQSYVNKPWNREDAERALKIESEYNMKNKVNAQSLIIKFPDTDLNKDIVTKFHSDILNIHFQNPCGPRYCFIQMAEDVNIDEAIKELEKIKFGLGHLKVEKKSLRDEDNPEEIDPYTLFIGNLPESVKTSEIKSKFPKAQDEETRKMKNTRNILMRYNSVDDAISDYKQAYGLMWDKRNINVRFRRKRGNACPPEEPKLDVKKVKEEPSNAAQAEKERNANHVELEVNINELKEEEGNADETKEDKLNHADKSSANQNAGSAVARLQDNSNKAQRKPASQVQEDTNSHLAGLSAQEEQPWTSQSPQVPTASEAPPPYLTEANAVEETVMLAQIKEEPIDYDDMDTFDNMYNSMRSDDDVDDDDDSDDDEEPDDSDDDEDDAEEPDDSDDDEDNNADDRGDDDEDEDIDDDGNIAFRAKLSGATRDNEEPSDHLDQMFSELENMTGDIGFLKQ